MRATVNIDDELFKQAAEAAGVTGKTEVIRAGLEALVQRAAARRLIEMGGKDPKAKPAPRRRAWQDPEHEQWQKSKQRAR